MRYGLYVGVVELNIWMGCVQIGMGYLGVECVEVRALRVVRSAV